MALNLENQLLFYGAYHHNPINVGIHMVCVPMILLTAFLFGTNTQSLIPIPSSLSLKYLPPNLGTLAALIYSTLYILLEPVAGSLLAPILIGAAAASNFLTSTYGSTANRSALGIHIASWLAQFVGHGIYEGRAPALLDNLFQAVFLAPFFVWFEVLFACGYRPELKSRLDKQVEKEVNRYQQAKRGKQGGAVNGTSSSERKEL